MKTFSRLVVALALFASMWSQSEAHRGFEGLEKGPIKIEDKDKRGPFWQYGNFWQGDIRATYETIAAQYGTRYARKMVKLGLAEPPRKGRNLDIYLYNSWTYRNAEGQVLIPYTFAGNHGFSSSQLSLIQSAMQSIEDATKVIKFVPYTSEQYRLVFQSENSGCWSYIGRVGFSNGQPVNLQANGCVYYGIIQHEILHALGLYHEQSRQDRDNYITVLPDNVISGYEHNFNKAANSETLGVGYDYESVMHYGPTGFGKPRISCSSASQVCNSYTRIRFVGTGQDASPYCLTNQATLEPCDSASQAQMLFLNRVGDAVQITDAFDTSRCLYTTGGAVTFQTCTGVDEERFQLHASSLSGNILVRWDGYNVKCLDRNTGSSSGTTSGTTLVLNSCSSQYFALDFGTNGASYPCQSYPLCSRISGGMTTIDSHGASIGQRNGISEKDILQLQLLYQCPSGRRQYESLCDATCPCFEGQYSCNVNEDCRGELECSSSRICQQPSGTLKPTARPTDAPSKSPTLSPTRLPTESPVASTDAPTKFPTVGPTKSPTGSPVAPTNPPSKTPTLSPTRFPTESPVAPTDAPSKFPTLSPTKTPTKSPVTPTNAPSKSPTLSPTKFPTQHYCLTLKRKQDCDRSTCQWGKNSYTPGNKPSCYPRRRLRADEGADDSTF